MNHLISTPVLENQKWEQFYCIGEGKWNKGWHFSAWLVNRASTRVSWRSKQEKILTAAGFWSSLLQILLIFGSRAVSHFCAVPTAGLHTRALFPINCLQREEGKYPSPYTVQIPWPEPVGEKGKGNSFKILVSVCFEEPLHAALTTWGFKEVNWMVPWEDLALI